MITNTGESRLNLFKQYKLHVLGFFILVLSLPFYRSISTWAIALTFIFSIAGIIKKRQLTGFHLHWFLPLLFLYYTVSFLIAGGEISSLEKRLPLLIVPLLVGLSPDLSSPIIKNKIYQFFIAGNLLAVAICFFRALTRSINFANGELQFNSQVVYDPNNDFLTSSVMGGNYFFGSEFSHFLHPTYFGIFLVFAQALVYHLAISSKNDKKRLFGIVTYLLLFAALFLLSSKAAILSALLLTFYILTKLKLTWEYKGSLILGFVVILLVFVFFNPRLRVFKDTFSIDRLIDPSARFGHDLRALSWDASIDIINDNWLLGVGEAKKDKVLVNKYIEKGYAIPAKEMFNSHNMFLDFAIAGGLSCASFFVIGLFIILRESLKQRNLVFSTFILIFTFNGLFENLLSRNWGIMLFSIFITLNTTNSKGRMSKKFDERR